MFNTEFYLRALSLEIATTLRARKAITRPIAVTVRLTISIKWGPLISRSLPQTRIEKTPPYVIEQLI